MDDLNRVVDAFAAEAADPAVALADLGDNNFFLEEKAGYAKEDVYKRQVLSCSSLLLLHNNQKAYCLQCHSFLSCMRHPFHTLRVQDL